MNTFSSQISRACSSATWPRVAEPAQPSVEDGQLVIKTAGMSLSEERVAIRYRLIGRAGAPVLVTLGGISADRCMDQWWSELVGPGLAFDPERFRLLSMDWLSRSDGQAVLSDDQAIALSRLLDELGIESVQDFIGASYGAMVGLAFAARFPQRIGRLIAISGPHQAHPMSTARRLVQRDILRLAAERDVPERGVALARALALTTYRPPQLFAQAFAQDTAQARVEALRG